ncbi:hypothetical protein GIB67_003713 [Kingdonia uniflora]|uniref:Glycoside hydrolase family 5 domain-containing protein n=1 Tax=Kingdonia uniflora TaxID=39325 RepID=A0A7J7M3X5_9MAGN|nr:hypothetical protein GIB67_003713 [Kingdonia uniflora]
MRSNKKQLSMRKHVSFKLFLSLILLSLHANYLHQHVKALPLHTSSRWIVDENGTRVKLACVNWASHLETMVAEGLSKQPVDVISERIGIMGYNCVRFTWPLFLATNNSLSSLTVRKSLESLGLNESIAGIEVNNPCFLDYSLIQAFQVVVSSLANHKIMVILDNHISKPGWCCSSSDGNGFFGDKYFNPDLWIKGLSRMANMFVNTSHVVGMSLRNELRGPKQNISTWYRYMQEGAEAVHAANPNVIVILSGLEYDKDFSFIAKRPLNLTFSGKLVFEAHWYGFSDGIAWETGNSNEVCGKVVNTMMRKAGFLLEKGWPLFISEFGVDQRGGNVNDNRYLNCMFGVAAELDLDWALWTLVGSYYLREGVRGLDETYGLLNNDWGDTRSPNFSSRIKALQAPFQGPGLSRRRTYNVLFHPSTGLCVLRQSQVLLQTLKLGSCSKSEAWVYTTPQRILLKGTYYCIQASKIGMPVTLGILCNGNKSQWKKISESGMHLSSKFGAMCMDVSSSNTIITSLCKCLEKDNKCDPGSQWFKIINSTRDLLGLDNIALPTSSDGRINLPSENVEFHNERKSMIM